MPAQPDLDLLVLLALLRLPDDGYGVAVQREIAAQTGRDVALGAVYTALGRLEAEDLVASRLGPPTPVRGGRRKKLYVVLPAGRAAVREAWNDLKALTRGLAPRLRLT